MTKLEQLKQFLHSNFRRLSSTHEGLAVVLEALEEMDGRITALENPKKGSKSDGKPKS